jgi:HPt (histidine-containing phosphotransfer) domain-containing protein
MGVGCVSEASSTPALDMEELLSRCMGRVDLLEKLLANFDGYLTPQVSELEQAVQLQDAELVRRIAHRLKGAALTVSARALSQSAERLEARMLSTSSDRSTDCLDEVLWECERLSATVREMIQKEPVSVSN